MSQFRELCLGDGHNGINVLYARQQRELTVYGWYDEARSLEGGEVSLGDFLRELGITLEDCRKALAEPDCIQGVFPEELRRSA